VLGEFIGESEKNLHAIFENARRKSPCVLFFDELDALGHKRTNLRGSAARNVVAQLLVELDGVQHVNDGIFVLGATNHPWDVDSALRRPGRFARTLCVLPPDVAAREAILQMNLHSVPTHDLALTDLAKRTEQFSGADLVALCEAAGEIAITRSIETGQTSPICMADFAAVSNEVRPSTISWIATAKNFAQFANDGGQYDDLLDYLRSASK
jgi:SpoVK/Ycf46/Vps4 family AAA+-type ATPase